MIDGDRCYTKGKANRERKEPNEPQSNYQTCIIFCKIDKLHPPLNIKLGRELLPDAEVPKIELRKQLDIHDELNLEGNLLQLNQ